MFKIIKIICILKITNTKPTQVLFFSLETVLIVLLMMYLTVDQY